jgi:hypothetical protein
MRSSGSRWLLASLASSLAFLRYSFGMLSLPS